MSLSERKVFRASPLNRVSKNESIDSSRPTFN